MDEYIQNKGDLPQLAATTDACGSGIRFTYGIGGHRTRAMTSAGSAQQYEYDAAGNITGIIDGGTHTQDRVYIEGWYNLSGFIVLLGI